MNEAEAKQLEQNYEDVIAFYDMADDLIATVLESPKEVQEEHFRLVNPLVEQLEESADVLTAEFIGLAEGKETAASSRSRVEAAFRKVYAAMDDYQKRAAQSVGTVTQKVTPVFDGIKRHVEKVITFFFGLVELALDRIMQKNDLEQLKKREEKIAGMLHTMSQSHSKTS